MKDEDKTREQLIKELAVLRQQTAELEASEGERKRAEEALRESEEKYHSLLNAMNDGFLVTDKSGVFTLVNKAHAKIHGFERPEELIGPNVSEFVPPEVRDEVMKERQKQMKTGKSPEILEVAVLRKDGSIAYSEFKPSPVMEKGRIVGISGVLKTSPGASGRRRRCGSLMRGTAHW